MARNHGSGQRQAKLWQDIPGFRMSFTGDDTQVQAGLSATAPETVLRMIGEYVVAPDAATVDEDDATITVGIGVVSTDAFTLGATAMPDPAAESDFPWLYWKSHPFVFNQTGVDPNVAAAHLRQSFDIKSMRKITARQTLTMIVQYGSITGDPPIQFSAGITRVLVGLH